MPRRFNTGGPCQPDIHYMLPPLRRLPDVRELVDGRSYFVVHAPRQTGKTTAILALANELTRSGKYTAAALTVETAKGFDEIGEAEPVILSTWMTQTLGQLPDERQPPAWPDAKPAARIVRSLSAWSRAADRPLVLFLDEVDSLRPETLGSFLGQIRAGFPARPAAFPWSLALVGMRDVRDYVLASGGSGRRGSGSPFNISSGSYLLRNFTADEIAELYGQHTGDTGQAFTGDAVGRVHALTDGQPWLVCALARECVERLVPDGSPIDVEHIDAATARLIARQDTHLDSLVERLREPRVRKVIEPILIGGILEDVTRDDTRYTTDLGLTRADPESGELHIANPIYREVIPRALVEAVQLSFPKLRPTWLDEQGELDEERMLEVFLAFWRQHGEPLMRTAPYHELAPHLVLMAFLHRVVNGGGTLEREYAISSGRLDLCLRLGAKTLAIELKVWRPGAVDPVAEGLVQLDGYLAGLGLQRGWLVVFDRRPDLARLAERTRSELRDTPSGRTAVVIRA